MQAEGLWKIYNKKAEAVKGVNICLKKGSILGLLGPNGAGKSSTFNMLTL